MMFNFIVGLHVFANLFSLLLFQIICNDKLLAKGAWNIECKINKVEVIASGAILR